MSHETFLRVLPPVITIYEPRDLPPRSAVLAALGIYVHVRKREVSRKLPADSGIPPAPNRPQPRTLCECAGSRY